MLLVAGIVLLAGVLLAGVAVSGLLETRTGDDRRGGPDGRFDLALIGDARYRPDEYPKFLRLRDVINAEQVAFTVHVGDIKGGGSCADRVYTETLDLFDGFASR